MDKPKVAIIIPNFNKANYLSECIKSALDQTYDNIEIIIVDDHSTDQSDKIIKKFKKDHQNIHYYRLTENHGVSYARNYGAKKTNADYLVFLDSDDIYVNKNKIKNEVNIINKNKIAFSQWVPVDVNGKIQSYQAYKNNPLKFLAISKILSVCLPPAKQLRGYLIPSQLFRAIKGYNTSMSYYEDFDLQCRLGLRAKFVYTKEIGEGYRLGTGGLSSRTIEDAESQMHSVQKKYEPKLSLIQKIAYYFFLKHN